MIEEASRAMTFALYFVGTVLFVIVMGLLIAWLATVLTRMRDRVERHRIHNHNRPPQWH